MFSIFGSKPEKNDASLFLIAQSGSFRPLPVKTQTIVEFSGTSSFLFNKPAIDAALAGSQKIPSSFPNIL